MIHSISAFLRRVHDGVRQTEQVYMVLVAVVIGLLGGLAAVGFRLLIRLLNRVAWHEGQYTLDYLANLPFWWKVLTPAVGGLIVGLITTVSPLSSAAFTTASDRLNRSTWCLSPW